METLSKTGFWKNRNVFITGANGFVGSWLAKTLVEHGANLVVFIRDMVPRGGLFLHGIQNKVTVVLGDITDYQLLERVFNEYEIDTCFHLAAQVIVQIANRSPISTFESNIKGTWCLLEACRKNKAITRVVVASSDKAYGEHAQLPYTEEVSLNGIYPYEASKVCTDILARSYSHTYSLPIAVTRCANIYGGGDLNFSRIIPDALRSIFLYKQDPIIRSDGSPVRDYMYVMDAVSAYLTLAEKIDVQGVRGTAFNFGTEQPTSVLDLVEKIINISGENYLKPKVIGRGNPSGEIEKQYLSSKKAREVLGWEPRYTLNSGLKETVEWYREYFVNKLREGGDDKRSYSKAIKTDS